MTLRLPIRLPTPEIELHSASKTGADHPMKSYDAIVVGAGHNGLTNAAYLAKSGLDVFSQQMQLRLFDLKHLLAKENCFHILRTQVFASGIQDVIFRNGANSLHVRRRPFVITVAQSLQGKIAG